MKEGLFAQEYLPHCKGKREPTAGAFSAHANKRDAVWSFTISTDQRAQSGLLFQKAPCGTTFSPPKALTLNLPTLIDKIAINGAWNVWFFFYLFFLALTLVYLSSCPIPSPPAWYWPSQQNPFCPLFGPRQPWEEEALSGVKTGAH